MLFWDHVDAKSSLGADLAENLQFHKMKTFLLFSLTIRIRKPQPCVPNHNNA